MLRREFLSGLLIAATVTPEKPDARLAVSSVGLLGAQVVHNIGGGVQENSLYSFREQKAFGHYRWPSV